MTAGDTSPFDTSGFAGGFLDALGVQLGDIAADRATLTLPITPALHQPNGIVHGGVYCTIVETLASLGAAAWFEQGQVVGVSNQTDFLRAVREGRLTATGTPIHRGRLQQLWLVEIRDENERTVARGQVRLQNLPANRV